MYQWKLRHAKGGGGGGGGIYDGMMSHFILKFIVVGNGGAWYSDLIM